MLINSGHGLVCYLLIFTHCLLRNGFANLARAGHSETFKSCRLMIVICLHAHVRLHSVVLRRHVYIFSFIVIYITFTDCGNRVIRQNGFTNLYFGWTTQLRVIWKEWQTAGGSNKCWSGCHRKAGREGHWALDGRKESRMQWQDSEWIEKNKDWEPENGTDVTKTFIAYM